jgi:hypothetical protein
MRYPSWLDEHDVTKLPVQFVAYNEDENKWSVETFENLAAAREVHPGLDPYRGTALCTWAMKGSINGKPALRFETHAAYKVLST